jgi:hypothetical protein
LPTVEHQDTENAAMEEKIWTFYEKIQNTLTITLILFNIISCIVGFTEHYRATDQWCNHGCYKTCMVRKPGKLQRNYAINKHGGWTVCLTLHILVLINENWPSDVTQTFSIEKW